MATEISAATELHDMLGFRALKSQLNKNMFLTNPAG
jgi:hypothetical protein